MARIRKPPKTCYACNRHKVSYEHVPPQCFFPESKYAKPGQSLRKNLITVPSCDLHNIEKSRDDFYLLFVILPFHKNNSVAEHYYDKIISSIKQAPALTSLFGNLQLVMLNGQLVPTYSLDRARFDTALESVVRALHFHHYGEKWTLRIDFLYPDVLVINPEELRRINVLSKSAGLELERVLQNERRFGDNPEVFHYQIHRDRRRKSFLLRMVFYGGFVVCAMGSPEDVGTFPAISK